MLTAVESGLLVFKLIDGEFAGTGGYVDILMDDMAYPSYSSAKIKSRNMTFNEGRWYPVVTGMLLIVISG